MRTRLLKSNYIRLSFVHALIWSFFIATSLVQFYQSPFRLTNEFYIQWLTAIILFYLNYFYLVPKLLLQKKYFFYFLWIFVLISIFLVIKDYFFKPKFGPVFFSENAPPPKIKIKMNSKFMGGEPFLLKLVPSFFYLLITAISIAIKALSEYYKNQRNRLVGETQKKTAELIYLRNQTNPHFLFNSLNSLYSLAYKKSDSLPDAIVSLSELMRYMLYETDHDVVPLEKELKYISNYIQLQKLRLNDIENIIINIHGETKDKFIEPLLLIVFIENAFKYGIDYRGVAWVKILIEIKDQELNFWAENKIGNHSKDIDSSGIGINNIQNRLEMIYPDSHALKINIEEGKYRVYLNLKLDGNKNLNNQL